ncbi:hypothetical protein ACWEKT_13370 [Nocardia takedensis]
MKADLKNLIGKARGELARIDTSAQSREVGGLVERLSEVVARIDTVQAGRLRVIVLGLNGSLKSTTLRLLIGECPALRSGAGPIIGPLTDIRLVQSEDVDGVATEYVTTLSESRARARILALLDLPAADPRSPAELAEIPHPNRAYVRDIHWGAEQFGYGVTLTVSDYAAAGGAIAFDGPGRGSTFLARRFLDQAIPRDLWDLSWARGRSVVLTDTPGTRDAGILEDLILREARLDAHISLLTTSIAAGSELQPANPAPGSHRILVLTRLDQLDDPSSENELAALRDRVMLHIERLKQSGRSTALAAVDGPWSADRQTWERLDPSGGGNWDRAESKKTKWIEGLGSAALADTELRTAVKAATEDGAPTGCARCSRSWQDERPPPSTTTNWIVSRPKVVTWSNNCRNWPPTPRVAKSWSSTCVTGPKRIRSRSWP